MRRRRLSIAIVPNKRGTGLGSELLDALLDAARADGYDAITLDVEKDSPAVGLYSAMGLSVWAKTTAASP